MDYNNYKGIFYDDAPSNYQDTVTGAHFEYHDLCHRLEKLLAQSPTESTTYASTSRAITECAAYNKNVQENPNKILFINQQKSSPKMPNEHKSIHLTALNILKPTQLPKINPVTVAKPKNMELPYLEKNYEKLVYFSLVISYSRNLETYTHKKMGSVAPKGRNFPQPSLTYDGRTCPSTIKKPQKSFVVAPTNLAKLKASDKISRNQKYGVSKASTVVQKRKTIKTIHSIKQACAGNMLI